MNLPEIFPISGNLISKGDLHNLIEYHALNNSNIIQFRMKDLPLANQLRQLMNAKKICLKFKMKLVINSSHGLNNANTQGLHLTSLDLMKLNKTDLPKISIIGASCHDKSQIFKANELNLDYIYVSPVLKTFSHQSSKNLGWEKLKELTKLSKIPIYALGGMKRSDLNTAKHNGAYGIAGIRGILSKKSY